MNDRFKFRVWCKNKKEWEKDCIFGVNGNLSSVDRCEQFTANVLTIKCIILNPENHIIEQCTGLKDKNGNLIYQGDLIAIRDYVDRNDGSFDDKIVKVLWKDGGYYLESDDYIETLNDACNLEYVEIIGNIHENSDLL